MSIGIREPRVKESITTAGVHNFEQDMIGLAIINTGTNVLTVTVNGMDITVSGGNGFDETFEPFKTITITTTSTFQALVRGW